MICKNCHTTVSTIFCSNCGTKVKETSDIGSSPMISTNTQQKQKYQGEKTDNFSDYRTHKFRFGHLIEKAPSFTWKKNQYDKYIEETKTTKQYHDEKHSKYTTCNYCGASVSISIKPSKEVDKQEEMLNDVILTIIVLINLIALIHHLSDGFQVSDIWKWFVANIGGFFIIIIVLIVSTSMDSSKAVVLNNPDPVHKILPLPNSSQPYHQEDERDSIFDNESFVEGIKTIAGGILATFIVSLFQVLWLTITVAAIYFLLTIIMILPEEYLPNQNKS